MARPQEVLPVPRLKQLWLDLEAVRQDIGPSQDALYAEYYKQGGTITAPMFRHYLRGKAETPGSDPDEYNLVAWILNERLVENGQRPRVPYLGLLSAPYRPGGRQKRSGTNDSYASIVPLAMVAPVVYGAA